MNRSERTQALARMAMGLMSERSVPPSPENFQLFYAYAAGENPSVSHVMGTMIERRDAFTPQLLDALRERFFGPNKLETVVGDVGAEFSETIKSVLDRIAAVERDTEDYGRKLSAASGELGADQSPARLQKLVASLLGATKAMEARTKSLEEELQRSSHEVEELRTKLDDVRRESLLDPLTGVRNRKAFDAEFADAIEQARATGEPVCLFMCDIDHFKRFNDTWGHQTGDQVLRLVAQCLSENVKGRDTAARYGGEEFAVILRRTPLKAAITLANQIRSHVETKKLVKRNSGDVLGRITMSIGVAEFDGTDAPADLIQRADACLYAAKNGGRNRVVCQTELPERAAGIAAA